MVCQEEHHVRWKKVNTTSAGKIIQRTMNKHND